MTASSTPTAGPTQDAPDPGAPTQDAPAAPGPATDVDAARGEIDHLDEQIAALVARRREVSRSIQAARIATGGHRLHHSREVAVVQGYATRLGAEGAALATSVLRVCRGR